MPVGVPFRLTFLFDPVLSLRFLNRLPLQCDRPRSRDKRRLATRSQGTGLRLERPARRQGCQIGPFASRSQLVRNWAEWPELADWPARAVLRRE
jgi:hypothetical protein